MPECSFCTHDSTHTIQIHTIDGAHECSLYICKECLVDPELRIEAHKHMDGNYWIKRGDYDSMYRYGQMNRFMRLGITYDKLNKMAKA